MGVQLRTTLLALFALFLVAARPASAQNGSISGKITDAESGAAVVGAQVAAETFGGRIAASALSNERGEYALRNLAPGMYTVSVSSLGYTQQRIASVNVQPAANTAVDARMQPGVFLHDPITVSVSRRQEKATEAPASVAVIDAQAVAERPTVTPLEHIRTTPGVDILTHGLQSGNVVVRGFNNIFSTTLHMLTDNRLASVPSLRVNLFHFVPATDQDIERMEVVLGPGSALYGPNTANGVLHVITKSPLDHQGTTVSVGNGFQVSDALDGNRKPVWLGAFRTAHKLSDNFGFKLSGQYLSGSEWPYSDPREITAQQQIDATYLQRTCLSTDESFKATCIADIPSRLQRIGNRDFDIERWSVEARADWRSAGGFNTIFAYGRSVEESGIELTGVGAAQAKGWAYSYYQARANYNRWFGQIYLNTSDAGDTFLLTDGALIVDESKLLVAQLQHGFSWGERQDFTYGIDYFRTMPETKGTINGNNEDDDVTDEIGGYLQSETSLSPKLDLVLAGRVDNHSELEDVVFSPRAGIVFKPRDNHAVRLMYNRAFSTPANFSLWLDLNSGPVPNAALAALGFNLRAQGVTRDGISLHMSDNSLGMRSPFTPSSLGGPGQLLPGDANTLAGYWKAAVSVLAAGAAQQGQPLPAQLVVYMRDVLSPTGADLGITGLDINTQELGSLDDLVQDVPQLKPTTTNSVELGYTGILSDRVKLVADAWWSQRKDFTSDLRAQTPLVLYDGTKLVPWLVPRLTAIGVSAAQAQAIAVALAGIPLAVASSDEVNAAAADILASYRNFGEVTLWGGDLGIEALLSDQWSATVSGSWASDHFFKDADTDNQLVALNAPKFKGSASLAYHNSGIGFNGDVRVRHIGEFPVNSQPFLGLKCIVGEADIASTTPGADKDCVKAYTLVDLTLGYRLPMIRRVSAQLAVQNLFDKKYQSFLGVPEIGRFGLLRLNYQF